MGVFAVCSVELNESYSPRFFGQPTSSADYLQGDCVWNGVAMQTNSRVGRGDPPLPEVLYRP
jgi:hypothetical protein